MQHHKRHHTKATIYPKCMHKYPHLHRIKAHTYCRESNYKKIPYSTSRFALLLNECVLFQQRKHSANSEYLQIFKKQALMQISTIPHNQPLCLNWTLHTLLKPQIPLHKLPLHHPPQRTPSSPPTSQGFLGWSMESDDITLSSFLEF